MKTTSKKKTASGPFLTNTDPVSLRNLIAKKAFELFEMRGCRHGHHEEDWLEAERIVYSQLKPVSEVGPETPKRKSSRTVATQRQSARR